MIEHLVFFKLKPELPATVGDQIVEALRSLKTKVPGILELSAGKNFSARAQGFSFGLMTRFHDLAALEAYAIHPEHQKVVQELIKPNVQDVIALDYEF